eukprot:jgi/Tetstr1/435473/TSEL_024379.t1
MPRELCRRRSSPPSAAVVRCVVPSRGSGGSARDVYWAMGEAEEMLALAEADSDEEQQEEHRPGGGDGESDTMELAGGDDDLDALLALADDGGADAEAAGGGNAGEVDRGADMVELAGGDDDLDALLALAGDDDAEDDDAEDGDTVPNTPPRRTAVSSSRPSSAPAPAFAPVGATPRPRGAAPIGLSKGKAKAGPSAPAKELFKGFRVKSPLVSGVILKERFAELTFMSILNIK